ncbi:MAG TPA: HAD family phosphatase [Gemmatimonadales bacterium]|nr:HAD family phosphatase [Gemmatimonadales bacterium]
MLPTRIRAIVFDFGGVLIDWNPRYLYRKLFPGTDTAMERFLAEIGFTEWNQQQDAGRAFSLAVTELVKRFPSYADLIRAYDERWEESIAGPLQGTVDLLLPLQQAGLELHGLSNWSSEKFAAVRSKYSFFQLFATILLSGDVKLIKPDPRIFQALLERIGRSAGECLFIDDSEENISTARSLGFEAIRFASPEQLRRELRHRGLLPR